MSRNKQALVLGSRLKALRRSQNPLAWLKLVLRRLQASGVDSQSDIRQTADQFGVASVRHRSVRSRPLAVHSRFKASSNGGASA